MKDLLTLIRGSDPKKVTVERGFVDKTIWYFTNASNRLILPHARIEISASKFGWPSLVTLREGGRPTSVFVASKLSFVKKFAVLRAVRRFKRHLTRDNDMKPDGLDEVFTIDRLYAEGDDYNLEFLDYDHGN